MAKAFTATIDRALHCRVSTSPEDRRLSVAHGADTDGPRSVVLADPSALPFGDGEFTTASVTLDVDAAVARRGELAVRELVRVTRPDGSYTVAIARSDGNGRAMRLLLANAGLVLPRDGIGSEMHGRRELGVTAQVWSSLAHGAAAASWNDEMFRAQATPYDPTTVAGWISLRRVRWLVRTTGDTTGLRVLEIGCESGGLLRQLRGRGFLCGLDLSGAALHAASGRNDRRFRLVQSDATTELPFRDESFDLVIASEMLEHSRSPRRVLANAHRVLRRSGRALVTIPEERRYLRWKQWLRLVPLGRIALAGIEEGPAAWHIHHDFGRAKLAALVDGLFTIERHANLWGTTSGFVLRRS
ncbi:MAG: hypothetical protein QOD06_3394 [Candidatus Binatota bacterium]|jgi:SAM-dependent methyltransferase|nr:hypothetical protein [Candidatus Binatota bacterium]